MKKAVLIVLLLGFLISCKKPEDRRCLKSIGAESEIVVEVDPFDRLYLKEHVHYVLVQDTVEKLVIKGGKNLLNFISAEVIDNRLEIYNENKCSFLRSYDREVTVEIHFKELINIHYEGTETLTNKGTLELGWFVVLIRDGAGPVNLNFNADAVFTTISHGWGDFTYTGSVDYANLNVRSNGYCDTYGLTIQDSITVISNTPGTVKVNANNAVLKAEINGSGDIWYKGVTIGEPIVNRYGSGELVDKN
jgi:hypothetical protein